MKIGFMKTEDNKTKDFFSGTTVDIALQPIDGKKSNIECYTQTILKGFAFSHHQKTVITDTPIATNPNQRRLVAFIGGLDLTGGRYDTPEHPLFHTLLNEHKDDFINPTLPSLTSSSGPREPFHDIHSRVEGPVARDILKNFEERWEKCANSAVQTEKNLDLVYNFHGWESWSVQMFRSINEYSVDLDTYQMSTGSTQIFPNIQQKRGTKFDRSLHRSYIHHIRRAQSFIYMENQYFKGSRHMWQKSEDGRAGNLIPIEIVIKIEEKITRNESFVAYIVIPMFPSGKPDSTFIQEMLYKQKQTIDLMYSRIAKAIKRSSRPDAHPQDYLLFFCLGSKVPPAARPESLVPPKEKGTDMAFHNRRNMIYVHSKMAIFDDEYIIVGSANINDRSMSGSRDTEIAIGAYQPNALANGDISVFRKALWAEHLGSNTPTNVWDHPGSLQCSKRLHQLGEESLQAYIKIGDHATPHHLMIYPLRVYQDGKVTARPDFEYIPDTKAKIIGSMSIFPQVLTA
ncbi:unnamed protein product [Meganyctiphanes norvegica]|uniref:phospholipase D n=1 Tax=Meganyctiphanes norvegica TaxID=48144 RepID=A0AAV2R831_MEGNR